MKRNAQRIYATSKIVKELTPMIMPKMTPYSIGDTSSKSSFVVSHPCEKINMTYEKPTMNEDVFIVFPMEHGGFSHVNFQGV